MSASPTSPRGRVLVAQSTSPEGVLVASDLQSRGWDVVRLIRGRERVGANPIWWRPADPRRTWRALENATAAILPRGVPAQSPKQGPIRRSVRVVEAGVKDAELLARAIAKLEHPPEVLIHASSVAYYGHVGRGWAREGDDAGRGLLATAARRAEDATGDAEPHCRVVRLRLGHVLDPNVWLFSQLLKAVRRGRVARIGGADPPVSWISRADLGRLLHHVMATPAMEGSYNASAPTPVSQSRLLAELATTLERRAFLVVPRWAVRWLVSDVRARELLLRGQRVETHRLTGSGFELRETALDAAHQGAASPQVRRFASVRSELRTPVGVADGGGSGSRRAVVARRGRQWLAEGWTIACIPTPI